MAKHPIIFFLTLGLLSPSLSDPITPLGSAPDWAQLQKYQRTITRDRFVNLLDKVYAPKGAADKWIKITEEEAQIRTSAQHWFRLKFAPSDASQRPIPKYWRAPATLPPNEEQPLAGLTIALDPGHLGGAWAKMEERWFQIGGSKPVTEGDLTLRTAQLLAPRLRALGAHVVFVRSKSGPITSLRPGQLRAEAKASLKERKIHPIVRSYSGPADPEKEHSIRWESERLFYRVAEIHQRARLVNRLVKPDLTICLHFNAEPWGDPAQPTLTDLNHLHLIVNGAYSREELADGDVRFDMLMKLLGRDFDEELGVSESLAEALSKETGLPAYHYNGDNAVPVGTTGYVWARNLLANRLYRCPVAYVECYVMNSRDFFERFQAGEYEGLREFQGVMRKNIYREYVDGVVQGLADYFRSVRTERPANGVQ